MVSVSVKTNPAKMDAFSKVMKANANQALRAMAQNIVNDSKVLAPKKEGTLRRTATIRQIPDGVQVRYGDGIRYAMAQERGIVGGKYPVRRYTTPGTQAHYLETASNRVIKQGIARFMR